MDEFVDSIVIKIIQSFSHSTLGNFVEGKIYEVPKSYGDKICDGGLAEEYIVPNTQPTKIKKDIKELLPNSLINEIQRSKDTSEYFDK